MATADNAITIGFADTALLRPKTLLKSNELNPNKAVDITLILRRGRGANKFNVIIQGDIVEFCTLFPDVFESDVSTIQSADTQTQNNADTE